MNFKARHYSVILVLFLGTLGCQKAPDVNTVVAADGVPRIEAAPFRGETYRSVDGHTTLTLISPDELEMRQGGTTFLTTWNARLLGDKKHYQGSPQGK